MENYNDSEVAGTPVTFEILQDGSVVETVTTILDADGHYSFEASLAGDVTIRAKASHWLAKERSIDLLTPVIDFSLINGDINGDNRINVLDYAVLKANYNKTDVSGHAADLNGDSRINVLDYIILKKNYNKIGE